MIINKDDIKNNLIELQNKSNVKLFKKNNNSLVLRDTQKIIDECNKMKRKKLLDLSNNLKQICNDEYIELYKIKNIQNKINSDIDDLDNIINIISSKDYINISKSHYNNIINEIQNTIDNYIEIYEN
jgi:hypothetical protein